MSLEILERVQSHIVGAGLESGYTPVFWRYNDEYVGTDPFIMYRMAGDGISNSLLQQPEVMVMVTNKEENTKTTAERVEAIRKLFRGNTTTGDVARFELIGMEQGPFPLENFRVFWMINVRVYVEDQ